jgi:hypothetical protein
MKRLHLHAALAGLALLLATAAGPARATTFAELSLEQYTDAATYVVEGTVTEVWTELDPESSYVWTRARVDVTDVLKGHDLPSEIIVDSIGGTFGNYSMNIPGQAVFSEGEQIFVFLDKLSDDRLVPVSKFLGKYTIRRATGDTRQYARTWHPHQGDVFDHRFLPHPDPENRLYVDDLRDLVRTRVETGWDGKPIPGLSLERLQEINLESVRIPR